MTRLEPPQHVSLTDKVAEQLKAYILEQHLAPGDRLPTERQLTKALGVSRTVIREAIRSLEILGLVTIRQGGGTFVREQGLDPVIEHISFQWRRSAPRLENLLETRIALELAGLEMAVKRAQPEDLAAMRTIQERMERRVREHRDIIDDDAAFHRAIFKATHNPVFYQLSQVVSEFFRHIGPVSPSPEPMQETLQEHSQIIQAIAERDVEWGKAVLRRHLGRLQSQLGGEGNG